MLSDESEAITIGGLRSRLNAPYGARCFLTGPGVRRDQLADVRVLMHLMALGAF